MPNISLLCPWVYKIAFEPHSANYPLDGYDWVPSNNPCSGILGEIVDNNDFLKVLETISENDWSAFIMVSFIIIYENELLKKSSKSRGDDGIYLMSYIILQ